MELKTITMPKQRAREEFLRYREALDRRGGTDQDRVVMEGYRVLSQGKTILELNRVMAEAGLDFRWRPRLAIARADAHRVQFNFERGAPRFSLDRFGQPRGWHLRACVHITLNPGTFAQLSTWSQINEWHRLHPGGLSALVPTIPPALRPRKAALPQHLILWEAEWEDVPTDPILLRPIAGSLYAVVAQWDLTELERAVLGAGPS